MNPSLPKRSTADKSANRDLIMAGLHSSTGSSRRLFNPGHLEFRWHAENQIEAALAAICREEGDLRVAKNALTH